MKKLPNEFLSHFARLNVGIVYEYTTFNEFLPHLWKIRGGFL